jgi:AcrR family transcriptional regulator
MPETGRRRADAARNAALVVTAARQVIAERGAGAALDDVPLDEVARRAGVGNATLYRHFPTRGDLLVAVYADELTALCDRGAELGSAPDPLDALFSWLDDFVVHVATKRALAEAATVGPVGRRTELFDRWHAAMHSTAAGLLGRAHAAGLVRSDLTVVDLLAMVSGAALTAADVAHARRLVTFIRRGVTPDE